MLKISPYAVWLVGLMLGVACGRVATPPPSLVENTAVAAAPPSTPTLPVTKVIETVAQFPPTNTPGITPTFITPSPEPTNPCDWKTITSVYYQYSFRVPIDLEKSFGVTEDVIIFTNDLTENETLPCTTLVNTIKLDFSAQPPGNFAISGQPPEEGIPADLNEFTLLSETNYPTWIKYSEPGEGADLSASSKQVYIQGPTYWYYFSLYCVPDWTEECETVLNQIIASFTIR